MGYLQNQLRAQAAILADDTITVADAPTGDIAVAAAAAGIAADETPAPADENPDPAANPDDPGLPKDPDPPTTYVQDAQGNFIRQQA